VKLRIENIEAGYGKLLILNGITLEVEQGKISGIIGPNGAGKSTLFKAIFGLIPKTSGSIHYEANDLTTATPREMIAAGLGYVPQTEAHFPDMTVWENLFMAAYTLPRQAAARRLEEILSTFPILYERRSQRAGTMSGGEQRILDIARAMVLKPALILVDEPSAGLDPKGVWKIYDLIDQLNQQGPGFLIVEQDVTMILSRASYIYALQLGRIAHQGPPEDFRGSDFLRDLYLGKSADMKV